MAEKHEKSEPATRPKGRRISYRILATVAYFAVLACAADVILKGADWALGRWVLISPWPPLANCGPLLMDASLKTYDYEYTTRTNSKGLRGEEIGPKKPGVYRILVIGDSYVFGWGVDLDQTWVKRLEDLFRAAGRPVEVINGGMFGNGPIEYAQRAEYLIPQLQPDLTLVSILQGSDLVEMPDEWSTLPNLRLLMQDWKYAKPPVPPSTAKMTAEMERASYETLGKRLLQAMHGEQRQRFDRLDAVVKESFTNGMIAPGIVDGATRYPDHYVRLTQMPDDGVERKTDALAAMLLRIQRISTRYGAHALAIVMPEGGYVNRAALQNWNRLGFDMPPALFGDRACANLIATAARQAGMRTLDLTPAFIAHGDEAGLFFVLDTHMSPTGNRLVADSIFPMLTKEVP
jgi:hypothetical protein